MKEKHTTKDKIAITALDSFFSQGIKKTSLEEVAQHAGVTRVTVYRYFNSKENLVEAAFMQVIAVFQKIETTMLMQDEYEIENCLDLIVQGLASLPAGDFPNLLAELQIQYPHIYETIHQKRTASVKHIFDHLFTKNSEAGLLREGLNQDIVRFFFMESIMNFVENPQLVGQGYSPVEIFATVKSLLLHGVLKKEDKK